MAGGKLPGYGKCATARHAAGVLAAIIVSQQAKRTRRGRAFLPHEMPPASSFSHDGAGQWRAHRGQWRIHLHRSGGRIGPSHFPRVQTGQGTLGGSSRSLVLLYRGAPTCAPQRGCVALGRGRCDHTGQRPFGPQAVGRKHPGFPWLSTLPHQESLFVRQTWKVGTDSGAKAADDSKEGNWAGLRPTGQPREGAAEVARHCTNWNSLPEQRNRLRMGARVGHY